MKNCIITITLFFIAHNNYGQGSADQWKYSSSNTTGIRYANFAPTDYQPVNQVKKEVEKYTPDKATNGMYPKKKGKLWGYMGTSGKWVIHPQWEWTGPFGLTNPASYVYPKWVLGGENYGRVIDRSGNYISGTYVLNFQSETFNYLEGYDKNNRAFIYNLAAEDSILLPVGLTLNNVNINNYLKQWHYHQVYAKDSTGKSIVVAILDMNNLKIAADHLEQYDYVNGYNGFNDTMLGVSKNKKWGFIDLATGKLIIPTQYDKAESFKDGIAAVEKDGVKFKIDLNGKKVE